MAEPHPLVAVVADQLRHAAAHQDQCCGIDCTRVHHVGEAAGDAVWGTPEALAEVAVSAALRGYAASPPNDGSLRTALTAEQEIRARALRHATELVAMTAERKPKDLLDLVERITQRWIQLIRDGYVHDDEPATVGQP